MSAAWPVSLPSAWLIGHTETPQPQSVAFEPLVGAPLLYQVGAARTGMAEGRMRISNAQRLTFLAFYQADLAYGTRRFTLTSASLDGETWLLQLDQAQPYQLEAAAAGWWLTVRVVLVRRLA